MDKLNRTYNPKDFEKEIYNNWKNKSYFSPKIDKNLDPFSIILPPPNITGQLHMGHALDHTIQDVLIRFKRMQGFSTLWLPGTDHASIATEVKIIEKLKKEENLTKLDISRDEFLKRAWSWKEQYGGRIVEQMQSLGLSCDWSREAFTMDEKRSEAVKKVFYKMYKKGYIYRGDRIINWCPCCKTAISDAEVDYEEEASHLWHIAYKFKDSNDKIVVATTRPETILGDTAVAVHPQDNRYKDKKGSLLILPLSGKEIPLVFDEYVEKDFGTGAVKITPAHDPNDFEVGLRHSLDVIKIMNDDGTLNELAGKYSKLTMKEAREKIVADLEKEGSLVKIEDYKHNVGRCYRCNTVIEPIVSKQWFMKMDELSKPAIDAVKSKKIKFVPERFSKIYFNWMENIKDWCISRQLWWGHRIPAYYCDDCGYINVSEHDVHVCKKCQSKNITQDPDVLDTWFSSALWPFSTLGYPKKTNDLKYFYPTSVLVTGYDIIFFWVARMIFSSIENMGDVPFSTVLLHGIVRDKDGRKMSKSLNNGVDPIPLIEKYGADSLRYSLLTGVAPGNDTRFSEEKIENAATFMNKIWNVYKFVQISRENIKILDMGTFRLNSADKWILSKINELIRNVTNNLKKYEIGLALQNLYLFVWNEYCDWYIELIKTNLKSQDIRTREKQASVLVYTFNLLLKLLHPFVPFVTEKLFTALNPKIKTIMLEQWPRFNNSYTYRKDRTDFSAIVELIKTIRNIRTDLNLVNSQKIKLYLKASEEDKKIIQKNIEYIRNLARAESIEIFDFDHQINEECMTKIENIAEIYIPVGTLIDIDKELERLTKEEQVYMAEINRSEKMLSNEGFISKAPKKLIEQEQEKLKQNREKLEKVREQIGKMMK